MNIATMTLKRALAEFFRDEFYIDAVTNLRREIRTNSHYAQSWEAVIRAVAGRSLEDGQALKLVHNSANLPLDENTEEEAYKWLTLMLINSVGAEGAPIVEY